MVNAGGSLVDTASSYGTSEEVIGAIASGTPLRDKLFIATKLEERQGPAAREEFATSLKRLRVTSVDLLQLHNVKPGDPGLGFFRDLQKEGLTRFVGATTTYRDDYDAMEGADPQGQAGFRRDRLLDRQPRCRGADHPGGRRGRCGGADRAAVRPRFAVQEGQGASRCRPLPPRSARRAGVRCS